jgi:predicted DNA-binding helix-hairpin-helix protein
MDTRETLKILSDDAQYDLACACGSQDDDRRKRSRDGLWIYPASTARGGRTSIMKLLLSNACSNDCKYCPLRQGRDFRRCTAEPADVADLFVSYRRQRQVFGLFLSSGVLQDADTTMDRINATARLLRTRHRYRGFLHLKIIPGASRPAIEEAISLASAVSLNVEAPTRNRFATLSAKKDFDRDIVQPIRTISELTQPGEKYARVKQTTQFVVGAAGEADRQIIQAVDGLYRRLRLNRVYFSAHQRGLGDPSLPGETSNMPMHDCLTREHRLYQVDFLFRRYKFALNDIAFEEDGNLSLHTDPKQLWADRHPEFFPVRWRGASRQSLLRVPGLGPTSVDRILRARRKNIVLRSLRDVGLRGKNLEKVLPYVVTE